MEAIVDALEQDGSDWAKNTLETLDQMSPTSLKITLREMNLGKNLDLHECLKMEYRLAVNCLANNDLYEGNFRIKLSLSFLIVVMKFLDGVIYFQALEHYW